MCVCVCQGLLCAEREGISSAAILRQGDGQTGHLTRQQGCLCVSGLVRSRSLFSAAGPSSDLAKSNSPSSSSNKEEGETRTNIHSPTNGMERHSCFLHVRVCLACRAQVYNNLVKTFRDTDFTKLPVCYAFTLSSPSKPLARQAVSPLPCGCVYLCIQDMSSVKQVIREAAMAACPSVAADSEMPEDDPQSPRISSHKRRSDESHDQPISSDEKASSLLHPAGDPTPIGTRPVSVDHNHTGSGDDDAIEAQPQPQSSYQQRRTVGPPPVVQQQQQPEPHHGVRRHDHVPGSQQHHARHSSPDTNDKQRRGPHHLLQSEGEGDCALMHSIKGGGWGGWIVYWSFVCM